MRIWEAIHKKLNAASAVTNLVGAAIYHGMRPDTDTGNYAINYFRLPGSNILPDTEGLVENPVYQISCRAKTPENAEELAFIVQTEFQNLQEAMSGFSINLANVQPGGGLSQEENGNWYHIPVTMQFVFFNAENI